MLYCFSSIWLDKKSRARHAYPTYVQSPTITTRRREEDLFFDGPLVELTAKAKASYVLIWLGDEDQEHLLRI